MRRAFVPLPNYNNFLSRDGRKENAGGRERERKREKEGEKGTFSKVFKEDCTLSLKPAVPDAEKIKFTLCRGEARAR